MKILLLGEFSGLHNELKNALIDKGHFVTLASANDFKKNYPSDINIGKGSNIYTYKLSQLILPIINLRRFTGFDVVHIVNPYIFPQSTFLNLFLVKFLKNNNKLVTLSGAGSDPFFVKLSLSNLRYSPIPSHIKYDRKDGVYYMNSVKHYDFMLNYMEYVDGVIPIMYEYFKSFCDAGFSSITSRPIPIPINTKAIPVIENELSNKKIVFFHGLNREGFKGTKVISEGFKELEKKYPSHVECVMEGNLPFNEYLKLLSRMNVVVDQLYSYSLAMNALYSMSQGKLVCGGAEPESFILYDGNPAPAYNITNEPGQLLETLSMIVENKENINEKSIESRSFVEKYHCPLNVADAYINFWSRLL